MSAAWQDALVVRDRLGQLRHAGGFLDAPITSGLDPLEIAIFADTHGPMEPILSRTGQPIVTTVGDLTARHIGKRVRVEGGRDLQLDGITHRRWDVKLDLSDGPKSGWLTCERDTPCEVLP